MSDPIILQSRALTAVISTYGARLEQLSILGGPSVVLHADRADHPDWYDTYAGAVVGPLANRVRGGKVPLGYDIHRMARNEADRCALHSGPDGLDRRQWHIAAQSAHAVTLRCTLPDGACGLPGDRDVQVIYAVTAQSLTLDMRLITSAPTPVSLAHHPYWRLGDAKDHRLQIRAQHYTEVDAHLLPTGAILPVEGTILDHRTFQPLHDKTDHNFCISTARSAQPRRVAALEGSKGLRMIVHSTEPGLQVYAGAGLPTLEGTDIAPFAGIALEPQGWPDAVNFPNFPSPLCTPDKPYRQRTRYQFERVS